LTVIYTIKMLKSKHDYLNKDYPGTNTSSSLGYNMNTSFGFDILSDPKIRTDEARRIPPRPTPIPPRPTPIPPRPTFFRVKI